MGTFSGQISQSSDDADQTAAGTVSLTHTTYVIASTINFGAAYRWQGVTIVQGAIISAASINLWFNSTSYTGTVTIDAVAVDNQATFTTSASSLSSLALTGNSVTWTLSTVTGGGAFGTSPSLVAAIQAVINRAGWVSGNSLAIVVAVGSAGSPTKSVEMYDGNAAEAAQLNITYSIGGDSDDSGTFGSTMDMTNAGNEFLANDQREGPCIGYRLRENGLWLPRAA